MHWVTSSTRQFARDDQTGVTVEFVATLPMILAALAIVFEFGRGLWYHHIVTKGVRDAARYAARYPAPPGTICENLDDALRARTQRVALSGTPDGTTSPIFWTNPETVTVNTKEITYDPPLRTPACQVTVRADVPYNLTLLTAFSGFWHVDPITIIVQDEARYAGD